MTGLKDTFLVLDGRAWTCPEDECAVYVSCATLKEARMFLREDFPDGRIARYRPTGEVQKGNPPIPMYEFAGWEDG